MRIRPPSINFRGAHKVSYSLIIARITHIFYSPDNKITIPSKLPPPPMPPPQRFTFTRTAGRDSALLISLRNPILFLISCFSLLFLSLGSRKPDFNHVYNENIYNLRFHRSHCYWFHMFHCCWYIKAQYQVLPIHDLWMIEMLKFGVNPIYFHCFEIWFICYAICWLC